MSSISEQLTTVAENVPMVYEAGRKSMWNAITGNNKRELYNAAFRNWLEPYVRPPYTIKPNGSISNMFQLASNLMEFGGTDKNGNLYFDLSAATTADYLFIAAENLVTVYDTGLAATSLIGAFQNCRNLVTIEKLNVSKVATFDTTNNPCFYGTSKLENITIEGSIQNSVRLNFSTVLTKESIKSIVNALSETITTSPALSLLTTAVNNAFGSTESTEWLNLIAPKTAAGWTISLT